MREVLEAVRQSIEQAALGSGRRSEEITLVAVSKFATLEQVYQAIACGQMDFGENRADKLLEKTGVISDSVRWHFIGQLQTNKVKYIIDKVSMVQSLDRLSLAKELDKRAAKAGRVVPALLEVRLNDNPERGGVPPEEVEPLLEQCASFAHLRVQGLMCVAPLGCDAKTTEDCFERVRSLFEHLKTRCPDNASMQVLSMVMSHDYVAAIRHGATMVRIGSAIFAPQQGKS